MEIKKVRGMKVKENKMCYICKESYVDDEDTDAKRFSDKRAKNIVMLDGSVKDVCYKCGNMLTVTCLMIKGVDKRDNG